MKRAKTLALIAIVAALSIGVGASASAAAATSSGKKAPVLLVAGTEQIDSLNPFIAIYQDALNVLALEYESLTMWSATNTEVGGLAQSWSVSDGGRVWTYHLRHGIKWSDGVPITAADAAWTYNAILKNSALGAANGSLVVNIQSVDAVNPTTFEIKLKTPQAPDPANGMPIVPEHIWSKLKNPVKYANTTNVVGSGPFILTAYSQNQSVTMHRNPYWFGTKPQISGVDFVDYQNSDAAAEALRSGAVDIVNDLTPAQATSLKSANGIGLSYPASEHYWSIDVNPGAIDKQHKPIGDGNPALHDIRVRQAIQDVIDQKLLVQKVLGGHGSYGPGIMPPAYPQWYLPNSAARPGGDAVANKLLDEAGWKMGPNGIREKDGKPLTLRFTWTSGNVEQQEVVSYVVPWLKQIGIQVNSMPESLSQTATGLADGNYDLDFDGWGVGPDPDYMLQINTCANLPNAQGSGNTTAYNWCTPAYDKLYYAQHVELNPQKRAVTVKQALKMLYNAAVVDVLYYDVQMAGYRSSKFTFDVPASYGVDGYWAYINAHPVVAAAGTGGSGGGSSPVIWIVIAVVVVGGIAFVTIRRRAASEDE